MPAKKSTGTKAPVSAAKPATKAAAKPSAKSAAGPSKKTVAAKPAPAAKPVPATKSAPAAAKKVAKAPAKSAAKAETKAPAKSASTGVFVRFERYSPKSSRVDLVGSFTGWVLGKYPLVRDENGIWSIQIRLAPGTYEYKYVYDGHFYEPDPEREQVANAFGSANNLLIVT